MDGYIRDVRVACDLAEMFLCFTIRKISPKDHNQMIKFKVRDNQHVLGVVRVSVNNVKGERESRPRWEPLTPHKRAGDVSGELQLECFVSAYRPGQIVSNSEKSSPLQSRFGSQEDILDPPKKGRFSFRHQQTPSGSRPHSLVESSTGTSDKESGNADFLVRASKIGDGPGVSSEVKDSDHGLAKVMRNNPQMPSTSSLSFTESPVVGVSREISPSTTTSEVLTCPRVTGISPKEGPLQGGQRVVLRGSNLGENREDILKVVVADVDCTSSLEYTSNCESSRIVGVRAHCPVVSVLLVMWC